MEAKRLNSPYWSIRNLFNSLVFYVGWLVCLTGAAKGQAILAVILTGGLISLDLIYTKIKTPQLFYEDLCLIAMSVMGGFVLESLLISTGTISYASPAALSFFPPIWLLMIYALFAISLNHSLSWLRAHPFLGALCGAIFSPLSYLAGKRLGAAFFTLPDSQTSLIIGFTWACYIFLLCACVNYFYPFFRQIK